MKGIHIKHVCFAYIYPSMNEKTVNWSILSLYLLVVFQLKFKTIVY